MIRDCSTLISGMVLKKSAASSTLFTNASWAKYLMYKFINVIKSIDSLLNEKINNLMCANGRIGTGRYLSVTNAKLLQLGRNTKQISLFLTSLFAL